MPKYIPVSLVILTIVIAIAMAGNPKAERALKRTQLLVAIYIVIWGFLCLYVYPVYVLIE